MKSVSKIKITDQILKALKSIQKERVTPKKEDNSRDVHIYGEWAE